MNSAEVPGDDPLVLARRLAARLIHIDGVTAVALGGSHARGVASPESDVDLGIYYQPEHPPALDALRDLAAELDDGHRRDSVTQLGAWGPWVNGGAWLRIEGRAVDWLYRDAARVARVIDDCRRGRVTCDYYLGHPHGFHNHIYMGEVHHAVRLEDPSATLSELKGLTDVFPPPMRVAIVRTYLYDGRFMLELGRKSVARGDVMHLAGCLFRVVAALVQVLFALNERYFVNEKGSVAEIEGMPLKPLNWASLVERVLGSVGTESQTMSASLTLAEALLGEVEALSAGQGLA